MFVMLGEIRLSNVFMAALPAVVCATAHLKA
jgi:hypothetical protein